MLQKLTLHNGIFSYVNENILSYCSTIWVSRQGRQFLCLFWPETRQRILGPEISPYPEVVRGGEWELTTRPSRGQLAAGQRQANSRGWRGSTDRGSQHQTPEQRGEAAWDRVQREWVKMSLIPVALWNFTLVTYASDSPHMHIVLQYLFSALG